MALVTHPMHGSTAAFPLRTRSWSNGVKMKHYVTTLHTAGRKNVCIQLRRRFCLSIVVPPTCSARVKPLRITAFKSSGQNDGSWNIGSDSKVPKNSANFSYSPKENEATITESPKAQNFPLPYTSKANESSAGSLAIHKLFRKWLTMVCTPAPSPEVDNLLGECLPPSVTSETQKGSQNVERRGILNAFWVHFLALDATIKLPLLIFIPMYMAVNVIYGAEVSKEMTPLWFLGPLIVSIYIKMFRGLCALYIFSFKQTVKMAINLPSYFLMCYNYIAHGKLKEHVRRSWQPLMDIKNLDYKEVSRRKYKELEVWIVEKYLDYVESIWPYYCRTIRFLKRANLI